jgi:3-oxoacyl-[acyl-carrier protein] reductase
MMTSYDSLTAIYEVGIIMLILRYKRIVVTGASSGLGRAIAESAAAGGAKVALMARREGKLNEIVNDIEAKGGEAIALPTDVSNIKSLQESFKTIDSKLGGIDIVFNCAGVVEPISYLTETSPDSLLMSLKVNVFGIYLVTLEALTRMDKQDKGGTIINITSGAGINAYAGWSSYCSQKAAVNMFTKCVALEMSDKPIRIAAISPGPFESRMQEIIRGVSASAFPSRDKFVNLYKEGKLNKPDGLAKVLIDLSLSEWPELSGVIGDLRSVDFQKECIEHGVEIG